MEKTKLVIYIIVFFITLLSLESINLNAIFKQNRVLGARVVYLLLSICISYLVSNFIYDFIM